MPRATHAPRVMHLECIMAADQEELPDIPGAPDAVLALGYSEMANPEEWTTEKANIIAHYLEVVKCLSSCQFTKPLDVSHGRLAEVPLVVAAEVRRVFVADAESRLGRVEVLSDH